VFWPGRVFLLVLAIEYLISISLLLIRVLHKNLKNRDR
jgi:hypothetical protein